MNLKLYISILITILFFANCTSQSDNSPKIKEISLERWKVEGTSNEYKKTSIQYLEKTFLNKKGQVKNVAYYSPDKQLKGTEIRIFDKSSKGPVGSQYKTPEDVVQSYYTYKCDDKGRVSLAKAYRKQDDILLRHEMYVYNDQNEVTEKKIYDADMNLRRTTRHHFDAKGQPSYTEVLSAEGKVLLTEKFRLTKFDKNNNWTEKWGFSNDKPFSCIVRSIKYY